MPTSYIEVSINVLAYHSWEKAPDHRIYLRPSHQHNFKITARCGIVELDRQIEFHDLRDFLVKSSPENSFDSMSCEQIAKGYYDRLRKILPKTPISIVVDEGDDVRGKYGDVVA